MGPWSWFVVAIAWMGPRSWFVVAIVVAVAMKLKGLMKELCKSSRQVVLQVSPEVVEKVNDSVYELYKPTGLSNMEIVFFHGLQFEDSVDVYKTTWMSADGSHVWPQTWLATDFPNARILAVSYDASLRKGREHGRFDMHNIGECLMEDLIQLAHIGQKCPVVLVGHSFGGLVMKQLCLQAFHFSTLSGEAKTSPIRRFLANVKGMFYYGTPHRGIPFMEIMTAFPPHVLSPLVEFVKVFSKEGARLNVDFDLLCKLNKHWRIFGVGEALPTSFFRGLFCDVIVPEASARYGERFRLLLTNHVALCKPEATTSSSYSYLKDLLQLFYGLPPQEQARPENLQVMPDEYVGCDRLEVVKLKLKTAKSVGIVGMGGIGKTTLAKAIFNDVSRDFEYSCFILDVKTIQGGVETVKAAVSQHMHHNGKKVLLDGLETLRGKRLLLILDDVDVASERDLDVVRSLQKSIGVHEESRFIMTSRHRKLLSRLEDVYEVPILEERSSRSLFISCAFRNEKRLPSFERCIDDIVKKCGGLPLALEVLGNFLYKESMEIWQQTVEALKCDDVDALTDVDEKLRKRLKLSYDTLPEVEKEMFIHAATFFHNEHLFIAKAAWSVTTKRREHLRWKHLVDRCLVQEHHDKNGDCRIRMHEQLQSLAWSIVSDFGEWGTVVLQRRAPMDKDGELERFWAKPREVRWSFTTK